MAIQVNGTTVINNSRALNNITSVDSTTKSAIETAGVGGSTVFLSTITYSSTTAAYDISLPSGYRLHRIVGYFPQGSGYSSSLAFRLGDSSGNIITTTTYNTAGHNSSGNDNAGTAQNMMWTPVEPFSYGGSDPFAFGTIDIFGARDSSKKTGLVAVTQSTYSDNNARGFYHAGMLNYATDNTKLRIMNYYSNNFTGDSTKIAYLYGIK